MVGRTECCNVLRGFLWLATGVGGLILILLMSVCGGDSSGTTAASGGAPDTDPPEVQVGERLFLESRFAEFFRQFERQRERQSAHE